MLNTTPRIIWYTNINSLTLQQNLKKKKQNIYNASDVGHDHTYSHLQKYLFLDCSGYSYSFLHCAIPNSTSTNKKTGYQAYYAENVESENILCNTKEKKKNQYNPIS